LARRLAWYNLTTATALATPVEEVLRDDESDIEVSRSSGRPTAFGWTSSGERIAVVFEEVSDNPRMLYPVSAYPVPPKRTKRGRKR
jgi:hypothetical protein